MEKLNLMGWSTGVQSIASSWSAYTVLGSFILYVTGYLGLRFHLTVLGVGTDLTVIDEKYLLIGIKFFIFFVSTIPISLLFSFFVYIPIKLLYFIKNYYFKNNSFKLFYQDKIIVWIGILLSFFMIQIIMRQSFLLTNLLVSKSLPEPKWLISILTQETSLFVFYFPLITLGLIPSLIILWVTKHSKNLFILRKVLFSLFLIQVLLLPINYGSLILDKTMPRVAAPHFYKKDNHEKVQFWLVWEGKEGVTYLTRNLAKKNKRTLVTLKKKDVKLFEVLCYDKIISVIFKGVNSCI